MPLLKKKIRKKSFLNFPASLETRPMEIIKIQVKNNWSSEKRLVSNVEIPTSPTPDQIRLNVVNAVVSFRWKICISGNPGAVVFKPLEMSSFTKKASFWEQQSNATIFS